MIEMTEIKVKMIVVIPIKTGILFMLNGTMSTN